MPEFSTNVDVTVEFEVYCDTCGTGLCGQSTTRENRYGQLEVHVEACPSCLKDERERQEERIQDLEDEIDRLKDQLIDLSVRG